jgi:heat shock protein HslJ
MGKLVKTGVPLFVVLWVSCAGTPANFSGVRGREWYLLEVRGPSETVRIDRTALEARGMGDIYSLRFSEERISGKGAPNRYTAPYSAGKDRIFALKPAAATLMAAIEAPGGLGEDAYFSYLNRISRWSLNGNMLELKTSGKQGGETVLVFIEHK